LSDEREATRLMPFQKRSHSRSSLFLNRHCERTRSNPVGGSSTSGSATSHSTYDR